MKARQILFNTEMVQAILGGRKIHTRRPVQKPFKECDDFDSVDNVQGFARCPFGKPGDLLYVRETWNAVHFSYDYESGCCDEWYAAEKIPEKKSSFYVTVYAADGGWDNDAYERGFPWRPNIHMPRWASRITLKVERVWVERVQNIDELRALNEGIKELSNCSPPNYSKTEKQYMGGDCVGFKTAKDAFSYLWDSIYNQQKDIRKNFPWESNPWVWACEFSVIKKNIDEVIG
ncbi:MAG: hypothetical protein KAJ18_11605 [Candidatus Omnitrophica bacterium]|nr:hypothetical protein [Candidatus Omnitrophota bacterium]